LFHSSFLTIEKKLKLKQKGKEYLPGYTGVLLPQASSFGESSVLYVLRTRLLLVKFIDQVPWFGLKMRIIVMTHLVVMSPSSTKPTLVFSLILG
jgi:hypothetical protein